MPFWLALGSGLLGLWQQWQQQRRLAEHRQRRADFEKQLEELAATGGVTPEQAAEWERSAMEKMEEGLRRRGLHNQQEVERWRTEFRRQLAQSQADRRRLYERALLQYRMRQAEEPEPQPAGSFLNQLVPLLLQTGMRRPGGQWWFRGYQPGGGS